jgi:hypothetical protein
VNLKTYSYRLVNKALSAFGLELQKKQQDFDARLEQECFRSRIFSALGGEISGWLGKQNLFEQRCGFNAEELVADIYGQFLQSPFRRRSGGSRFNNLCWLAAIAKAMQPSLIVDSGTFQGASAWAFSASGVPCKIISFDIDLSRILLRVPGVLYCERDWTENDWYGFDLSNALAYFDDHLDQIRRLKEAARAGFRIAIFDDDFAVTSFSEMACGGSALPKIEFALDPCLRSQKEIAWSVSGRYYRFPINAKYLDEGLSLIEKTERLPNTSLITGIHQTPYRLVRVAEGTRLARQIPDGGFFPLIT